MDEPRCPDCDRELEEIPPGVVPEGRFVALIRGGRTLRWRCCPDHPEAGAMVEREEREPRTRFTARRRGYR